MNRETCEHFTPSGIPCVKCQTLVSTGIAKGCYRSHPHENMDATCERYTQYERELASLRAELALTTGTLESRERNIEAMSTAIEQARMVNGLLTQRAERAEAERDAAVKDAERASWLIDTANREDIEATLLSRRQPHEIRALIDAARKGQQ